MPSPFHRNLLAALALLAFAFGAYQTRAATAPLATGTFWQIGQTRLQHWSDEQLAAEVSRVKEAGMDTILIHYSAIWDPKAQTYRTFFPNDVFPVYEVAQNRHPLRAIFRAAEKEDVQIVLGDFLVPTDLRYEDPEKAFSIWLSPDAVKFRRQLLAEFRNSPAFFGYYIPNEPNPHRVQKATPQWIEATDKLARFAKSQKRDLKVIHSIGLYAEWHPNSRGELKPSGPSAPYLDRFWRPWIEGIPHIDIWMMIDGVGTGLSSLGHTAKAQEWGREIVHGTGKEFWVDVENAFMNNSRGYRAFTIGQLTESLEVAAPFADKIVLFEHLNYMSPNSANETAQQLYADYLAYREKINPNQK